MFVEDDPSEIDELRAEVKVLREKQLILVDLVNRAGTMFEVDAPDTNWWRDVFKVTGEHMILTEEGWEPGSCKKDYEALAKDNDCVVGAYILEEVNIPKNT